MIVSSDRQAAASVNTSISDDVAQALASQQTTSVPLLHPLEVRVARNADQSIFEVTQDQLPAPVREIYLEKYADMPRTQAEARQRGESKWNGAAVTCLSLNQAADREIAIFGAVPYFMLLAFKEALEGARKAEVISANWSPAIAGGAVALVVELNGERHLVTQVKGEKVLNGGEIHPWFTAGGFMAQELESSKLPLKLGTHREFLQEGGNRDMGSVSDPIAMLNEGNPAQFRAFVHVLSKADGSPFAYSDLETYLLRYAQSQVSKLNGETPPRPISNLEVMGWHLFNLDRPRLSVEKTSDRGKETTKILAEGRSLLINEFGGLDQIDEKRALVRPIAGVFQELCDPNSTFRNALLEKAGFKQ